MSDKDSRQNTEPDAVQAELVERAADGRWLPGRSPNPGGLTKVERDAAKMLAESIRPRGHELIARLFEIALKGGIGNPTTVRAAEVLLERGYGKAPIELKDAAGNTLHAAVIILPGNGERSDDE